MDIANTHHHKFQNGGLKSGDFTVFNILPGTTIATGREAVIIIVKCDSPTVATCAFVSSFARFFANTVHVFRPYIPKDEERGQVPA